jgi:hypothetical protein
MALSSFGTPFTYPLQFSQWGVSPYAHQGQGINPYAFQPYTQNQPLMSTPLSSTIGNIASGVQPLQQMLPLLHIVPQQLQHLQQLAWVQLQELQQLQQIVQLLPGQLQQLQQLIQFVPQQHQQFQQPFGQSPGLGGFAATSPWGIGHQAFGAPPSHVM